MNAPAMVKPTMAINVCTVVFCRMLFLLYPRPRDAFSAPHMVYLVARRLIMSAKVL